MNNKNILIAVVVVVLILGGAFLFMKSGSKTSEQTTNQTTNQAVSPTTNTKEHVVEVTSSGYSPDSITINAGDKVIWENKSGTTVTVNSDLHPTHLLWPFLNLGAFDDGQSVSVVFDKAGTYTYHNHLQASQKGTVIVK